MTDLVKIAVEVQSYPIATRTPSDNMSHEDNLCDKEAMQSASKAHSKRPQLHAV